jgi:hypothetical protein
VEPKDGKHSLESRKTSAYYGSYLINHTIVVPEELGELFGCN